MDKNRQFLLFAEYNYMNRQVRQQQSSLSVKLCICELKGPKKNSPKESIFNKGLVR